MIAGKSPPPVNYSDWWRSLAGVALGGILVLRWGRFTALLGTGIAQALATLAYLLLLDHPRYIFTRHYRNGGKFDGRHGLVRDGGLFIRAMFIALFRDTLCFVIGLGGGGTHFICGIGRCYGGGFGLGGVFYRHDFLPPCPGYFCVVWLRFGRGLDGRGYDAAFKEETN